MVRSPRRLGHGEEVPLTDHLDELRNRLFVSIAVLIVAWSLCFWRRDDILDALNRQLPDNVSKPITLSPMEPFTTALTVSLYAALALSLPVLFYQAYAYVIPAFSQHTARRVWPMLLFVPALFLLGAGFSYYIILPAASEFLFNFDAEQYQIEVRAKEWYTFAAFSMLAVGILFEMPVAAMMLGRLGIISSRMMIKQWRYATVILVGVAVLLPTIDPISLVLETIPMLLLYVLSIGLVRLVEPKREESTDTDDDAATAA